MIRYDLYTPADEDGLVRLLAEVFPGWDPPAVAVGLTGSEFEAFVRLLCPRAATDGLTVIARSADTGEIVGALLTEDAAHGPPDGLERLSRTFDPILDILGQLDAEHRAGHRVEPGESMHLFLLGVDPRLGGQGIAQGLVRTCLANGARLGYRRATTEATNRRSQHVFRKLGFAEGPRRSYREHRFHGRAWFESIAAEGGPILMTRDLALA